MLVAHLHPPCQHSSLSRYRAVCRRLALHAEQHLALRCQALIPSCSSGSNSQLSRDTSTPFPGLFAQALHHLPQPSPAPWSLAGPAAAAMQLDKASFEERMQVVALRIPKQKCADLMRRFRGYTLDRPKIKCLQQDGDRQDTKLLLLDDKITQDLTGLSEELRSVVATDGLEQTSYEVVLGYGCLSASQVLRRLLPPNVEVPSAFECVGHIAHLNLREEQLPFKGIIGQVILDKHPQLRTVVNKVDSIQNEFRVFPMEVLAGDASMETEVVQHGARFRLDFSKVYWNSRLETEHARLVRLFEPSDVVVDIMAGIGPFAVPAAHKGCSVYANDLNPESAHWLAVNVQLNRVKSLVHVFNMDGRAFVRLLLDAPGSAAQQEGGEAAAVEADVPAADADTAAAAAAAEQPAPAAGTSSSAQPASENGAAAAASAAPASASGSAPSTSAPSSSSSSALPPTPPGFRPPRGGLLFQHAVMNLPASAVEFLDAFGGAFDPGVWRGRLPLVHVYTFKKAAESEQDIVAKVERYLGGPLEEPPNVHVVRDVAPNKLMLCVTFRVPEGVAFRGRQAQGQGEGAQGQGQEQGQDGNGCEGHADKRQKTG